MERSDNDRVLKGNMNILTHEINEHFIERLKNNSKVNMCVKIEENVCYIILDRIKEDLYISFIDGLIIVFSLNQAMMFIVDDARKHFCTCDTVGNAVYNGSFRLMTHQEILVMMVEFIEHFIGASKTTINEKGRSKGNNRGYGYPLLDYAIDIKNDSGKSYTVAYDNIQLNINID